MDYLDVCSGEWGSVIRSRSSGVAESAIKKGNERQIEIPWRHVGFASTCTRKELMTIIEEIERVVPIRSVRAFIAINLKNDRPHK